MILKNQNQSKMNLIDPEEAFQRESMNKSAMSSYEVALAKMVRQARSDGHDIGTIASSLKLAPQTVQRLLELQLPEEKSRLERQAEIEACPCGSGMSKESCPCDDSENDEDKKRREKHLNDAEAAYNELHGKKASKAALPKLSQVLRKSIQPVEAADDVTEMGGPQKQLRYHNSIWDSEVLERMAKQKDNGERIREEKAALAEQHNLRKQAEQRINWDQFREALENTELRKEASIQSVSAQESHKFDTHVQKKGLSIFANTESEDPFAHIAAKTEGEQLRDRRREKKEKDRSWVQNTTTKTSSGLFVQKMIDSMLKE
jgi:hypothetical protein